MIKNSSVGAPSQLITGLSVRGFKSIAEKQTIDIRPLTLLAGANSSGKSSIMQPLLLLKQTLEATYDPGALKLDGPNVSFSKVEQFLSECAPANDPSVQIGIRSGESTWSDFDFAKGAETPIDVIRFSVGRELSGWELRRNMSREEKLDAIKESLPFEIFKDRPEPIEAEIRRDRCFLRVAVTRPTGFEDLPGGYDYFGRHSLSLLLRKVIHLPGWRGNPQRDYPVTAIGPEFPGPFEPYTASLISSWSNSPDGTLLDQLSDNLAALGLTWKVQAQKVSDTQIELRVGRLRSHQQGVSKEFVNIADVGLGVSQTLPVAVSLLAAKPGQLVYLEQPEIHLHPRAQVALATLLVDAANRGVIVVAETHSSLLLLGVQILVAEGRLSPDLVKLHWFQRDEQNGATTVSSGELDEAGRFGEWPEDFGNVELEAQSHYLDVARPRASS